MRHLPRALNRTLLFIIGLILLAVGVGVALLPALPQWRRVWGKYLGIARDWYQRTGNRYRISDAVSWMQVAWIAIVVIVIILLLVWIFKQGGGKTDAVASLDSKSTAGTVTAEANLVNQVLQRELADERLIAAVATSAWMVKHEPGVKIKITTAKGADIGQIHEAAARAVAQLDSLFGKPMPVLVHISSGWLTKKPARTD